MLANVFEKFRNNSLMNYGSCPSHHLSAPGLICDAKLKITKIELELNPDFDMYISSLKNVEKSTRVNSKTNKKYLKSYDPKQESQHIIYLNVNNLDASAILNSSQ